MQAAKPGIAALIIALALTGSGCASQSATRAGLPETGESARLDEFFERVFEQRLARRPTLQSLLGIKDDYGKWNEETESWYEREDELNRAQLAELHASFDLSALSPAARLSFELFDYDARRRIEAHRWRHHSYPVNQMRGAQSFVPSFLIGVHKIDTLEDAEAYIERLRGVATYFDQIIGQLRLRAAKGIVAPRFALPKVVSDARNVISGRPFTNEGEDSVLRADFRAKIAALNLTSPKEKRLLRDADAALTEFTGPAYERLIAYVGLLEQRATTEDGAWGLPDGAEYYKFALARTTTTSLDAGEIHTLGLANVQRIHAEMRVIMARVGFAGELKDFFEFVRRDPQFYYPNTDAGREQYLREATAIIDAMRRELGELFTLRPKADVAVRQVEAFRERSAGKAFYQQPAPDGSRPGVYYVNLHDMADMPVYQMRALAYHEGIPGHHMQIAIQQELDALPRFRQFARFTAYSEGWGLYSEWLPVEIGAYEDPYADFGRLAMEVWRAGRLVVDTGIHSMRWTREEAIDYLLANTPNPENDIVKAVERYFVIPGQATAYMIGMLKIRELRTQAEQVLGEKFDVRQFHDAVLANGPVPLSILEDLVNDYIERTRRAGA